MYKAASSEEGVTEVNAITGWMKSNTWRRRTE